MNDKIHSVTVGESPMPLFKIHMSLSNWRETRISVLMMDILVRFNPFNIEYKTFEIPGHLEITAKNSSTNEFQVRFPMEIIDMVEKLRQHDVILTVQINALVMSETGEVDRMSFSADHKFSQREWIEVLDKIGYSRKWMVEIQRPDILPSEGVQQVEEDLKAANQLMLKGEYADVITRCRRSMEALGKVIAAHKERVTAEIDAGSPGEAEEVSKSHRFDSILKALQKASQIGPHTGYNISREDAEAILHLTTAMVAYYSKILSKISSKT